MMYCDYCAKIILKINKIRHGTIRGDRDNHFSKMEDKLEVLNPHKNRIRRSFWVNPLSESGILEHYLIFCNEECYQQWKNVISEFVEKKLKGENSG